MGTRGAFRHARFRRLTLRSATGQAQRASPTKNGGTPLSYYRPQNPSLPKPVPPDINGDAEGGCSLKNLGQDAKWAKISLRVIHASRYLVKVSQTESNHFDDSIVV